jgi:hypothetical protein
MMTNTSKKLLSILLILCITISIVTFFVPMAMAADTQPTTDAGIYHSLALKNDGTVWTWGRNVDG